MKPFKLLCIFVLLIGTSIVAAYATDIQLKKGSILTYAIKEGTKSFIYIITLVDWDDTQPVFSFKWQTDEKPKSRKGMVSFNKYSTSVTSKLRVDFNPSPNQVLLKNETRFVAPSSLQDYLEAETDEGTIIIVEKNKEYTISTDDALIDEYGEKAMLFNSKTIMVDYVHIAADNQVPEFGFFKDIITDTYFLANYKSPNLSIDLQSIITTSVKVKEPEIKNMPPNKIVTNVLNPVKLAVVEKKFPILFKLEKYDVTNGGTVKKPFSETYDFRKNSGAANPPSAIDCFTADLKILYNQRNKFGLMEVPETLSKNNFPSASATQLLSIYSKYEANKIPGYKPWTHWSFVKSLNITQINQLAVELDGYIKQYGFTE